MTSRCMRTRSAAKVIETLSFLRQQKGKAPGQPHECLADYIAPKSSGVRDYIGAFAVTAGIGIEEHVARFERGHDDYSSIMLKALADRLAEACAEHFHERVRREFWGYAAQESLTNAQLIQRGISRHPACARLSRMPGSHREGEAVEVAGCGEERGYPVDRVVCDVSDRGGQRLVFLAPGCRIISAIGKIDQGPGRGLRGRKGMAVAEMERWLSPNLGYEPE